jgi:tetratricopeptide (TPR) repeat protein
LTSNKNGWNTSIGDRSVQAAFAMSFRDRPATQQRLFTLLGIHPGPDIDLFATAALTGETLRETRCGLAGLHADHLIEETTPGRHRLHDLLRVYARTQATDHPTHDHQTALDRVLCYYLHTVQSADTYLPAYRTSPLTPLTMTAPSQAPDFDDLDTARAWLATELPTLIACVRHTTIDAGPHLAIHLAALTAAADIYDRSGQANALNDLSRVQRLRGEFAAALNSHTCALELFTAVGDRLGQANVLTNLGRVRHLRGEFAAALDNHTRALDLFIAVGDPDGQAETLNNLGNLALDYPAAGDPHTHFSRALTLAQDIGTIIHEAHALTGQAHTLLRAKHTTQAIVLFREAHSLYHTLDVPEAIEIQTILSTLDNDTNQPPDQPAPGS